MIPKVLGCLVIFNFIEVATMKHEVSVEHVVVTVFAFSVQKRADDWTGQRSCGDALLRDSGPAVFEKDNQRRNDILFD